MNINQHIKQWLARLEIKAATTPWADPHAAHHRNTRRAIVEICEMIREQLAVMGFDPALAVSLQRGEQAAVELAAIPDSETLQAADAAITRSDQHDEGATSTIIAAQIAPMATHFRDGSEPDFAHASLAELFAFCFPLGKPVLRGEALARVEVSRVFRNSRAAPSKTRGDENLLPFYPLKVDALTAAWDGEDGVKRGKANLIAAYQQMRRSPDVTVAEASRLFDTWLQEFEAEKKRPSK